MGVGGIVSGHLMGMSAKTVQRRQLLSAILDNRKVSSADVREIRLEAGQETGRHVHPCAVLGYIVAGTARYQIEGEAAQILPSGSAFYEPAETVIASFGNASDTEPLTFVAFYLKDGDQELITMLDA